MTQRIGPPEELDPGLVLRAYAMGVFPMAEHRYDRSVYWVEPKLRAILPLDGFRLSRSLRKTLRAERFRITADRAFADILRLCAESAPDRPETWINGSIERVFLRLHALGHAHSIECWDGDRLAGGLYGLALGRAFFGESMVTRVRDASKVAMAALVARLRVGGFMLLDCQFMTEHLASLGAVEVQRDDYVALLGAALGAGDPASPLPVDGAGADFSVFDRLLADFSAASPATAVPPSGQLISQLLGQTS